MEFDPNEIAFGEEKLSSEKIFTFDEPEKPTPSSQEETGKGKDEKAEAVADADKSKTDTPSASDEEKETDEEQRVPYSRFKKKTDEAATYAARVKALEEQLAQRQESKIEPKDSDDVPEEWKELYGDSELSKKAWSVQQRREAKLREEAVKAALELVRKEQLEVAKAEEQKEKALDEYLSSLKDGFGQQMSQAAEEELLAIVDEFSPTGSDGKYISLITPEKAIEIYNLRHAQKNAKTKAAREKVADLTSGKSQGEADRAAAPYKPSWDAWREAL